MTPLEDEVARHGSWELKDDKIIYCSTIFSSENEDAAYYKSIFKREDFDNCLEQLLQSESAVAVVRSTLDNHKVLIRNEGFNGISYDLDCTVTNNMDDTKYDCGVRGGMMSWLELFQLIKIDEKCDWYNTAGLVNYRSVAYDSDFDESNFYEASFAKADFSEFISDLQRENYSLVVSSLDKNHVLFCSLTEDKIINFYLKLTHRVEGCCISSTPSYSRGLMALDKLISLIK